MTEQTKAEDLPFRAHALAASLTVRDVAVSTAWYRDVVGFAVDRQHEREGVLRAVSMQAGAVRIPLGLDDGTKGFDRVKGEGFSLMLTTDLDVDAVAARIKAHGGRLDSEPADTPWGLRAFRVSDPDGFRLTIAAELRAPAR